MKNKIKIINFIVNGIYDKIKEIKKKSKDNLIDLEKVIP
jgi:hypothetical protein